MRNFLLIIVVITNVVLVIGQKKELIAAQSSHCGNGREWQLELGMVGHINPYPPSDTPNNLRKSPGSQEIQAQVYPGELFRVLDGPICTSQTGTSWWYVRTDDDKAGWTAEGNADEYWIVPFDLEDFAENIPTDNFQNTIELGLGAPIVGQEKQLTWGGGFGGCSFRPTQVIYHYGYAVADLNIGFTPNENIEVTIYRPDSSIYLREVQIATQPECSPAISIQWEFVESDPTGLWNITFKGDDTTIVNSFFLMPHSLPHMRTACRNGKLLFILEGFAPNEHLTVKLVEFLSSAQEEVAELMEWDITTDENGQLVATFSEDIERSDNRLLQVFKGNKNIFGEGFGGIYTTAYFSECR